jgi:hypothetical protein
LVNNEKYLSGGKNHTILPGNRRNFFYDMPAGIPKGKYKATATVELIDGGNPLIAVFETDIP